MEKLRPFVRGSIHKGITKDNNTKKISRILLDQVLDTSTTVDSEANHLF